MTNITGLRSAATRFNDFDGESWFYSFYFSSSWYEGAHRIRDEDEGFSWNESFTKSEVH